MMFKIITAKRRSGEPVQVIKLPGNRLLHSYLDRGVRAREQSFVGVYHWVVLFDGELSFFNEEDFKKEYEVIEQEPTCKPYCSRICLKQTDENFIPKLSFVALYRCPDCGSYYLAQRRGGEASQPEKRKANK